MVYLTDYSEKLDYYTPVLRQMKKMIRENPETVQSIYEAVAKDMNLRLKIQKKQLIF